jgi:hypothetical protein
MLSEKKKDGVKHCIPVYGDLFSIHVSPFRKRDERYQFCFDAFFGCLNGELQDVAAACGLSPNVFKKNIHAHYLSVKERLEYDEETKQKINGILKNMCWPKNSLTQEQNLFVDNWRKKYLEKPSMPTYVREMLMGVEEYRTNVKSSRVEKLISRKRVRREAHEVNAEVAGEVDVERPAKVFVSSVPPYAIPSLGEIIPASSPALRFIMQIGGGVPMSPAQALDAPDNIQSHLQTIAQCRKMMAKREEVVRVSTIEIRLLSDLITECESRIRAERNGDRQSIPMVRLQSLQSVLDRSNDSREWNTQYSEGNIVLHAESVPPPEKLVGFESGENYP